MAEIKKSEVKAHPIPMKKQGAFLPESLLRELRRRQRITLPSAQEKVKRFHIEQLITGYNRTKTGECTDESIRPNDDKEQE
ncbi:hypothetical protein [Escherichia coli]|uniref:hypothetical protein n=1 Tax=Escherichia coli TaxID=562 RepID=UPI00158D09CD|nr:hypothetical protein [Escherichia coli]